MKRRDLERWLRGQNARLLRNGATHDIWVRAGVQASVPRHREIRDGTARAICKQLGVSPPR